MSDQKQTSSPNQDSANPRETSILLGKISALRNRTASMVSQWTRDRIGQRDGKNRSRSSFIRTGSSPARSVAQTRRLARKAKNTAKRTVVWKPGLGTLTPTVIQRFVQNVDRKFENPPLVNSRQRSKKTFGWQDDTELTLPGTTRQPGISSGSTTKGPNIFSVGQPIQPLQRQTPGSIPTPSTPTQPKVAPRLRPTRQQKKAAEPGTRIFSRTEEVIPGKLPEDSYKVEEKTTIEGIPVPKEGDDREYESLPPREGSQGKGKERPTGKTPSPPASIEPSSPSVKPGRSMPPGERVVQREISQELPLEQEKVEPQAPLQFEAKKHGLPGDDQVIPAASSQEIIEPGKHPEDEMRPREVVKDKLSERASPEKIEKPTRESPQPQKVQRKSVKLPEAGDILHGKTSEPAEAEEIEAKISGSTSDLRQDAADDQPHMPLASPEERREQLKPSQGDEKLELKIKSPPASIPAPEKPAPEPSRIPKGDQPVERKEPGIQRAPETPPSLPESTQPHLSSETGLDESIPEVPYSLRKNLPDQAQREAPQDLYNQAQEIPPEGQKEIKSPVSGEETQEIHGEEPSMPTPQVTPPQVAPPEMSMPENLELAMPGREELTKPGPAKAEPQVSKSPVAKPEQPSRSEPGEISKTIQRTSEVEQEPPQSHTEQYSSLPDSKTIEQPAPRETLEDKRSKISPTPKGKEFPEIPVEVPPEEKKPDLEKSETRSMLPQETPKERTFPETYQQGTISTEEPPETDLPLVESKQAPVGEAETPDREAGSISQRPVSGIQRKQETFKTSSEKSGETASDKHLEEGDRKTTESLATQNLLETGIPLSAMLVIKKKDLSKTSRKVSSSPTKRILQRKFAKDKLLFSKKDDGVISQFHPSVHSRGQISVPSDELTDEPSFVSPPFRGPVDQGDMQFYSKISSTLADLTKTSRTESKASPQTIVEETPEKIPMPLKQSQKPQTTETEPESKQPGSPLSSPSHPLATEITPVIQRAGITDEEGEEEPDLQALARQVFPFLKRMILIERERRAKR